MTNPISCANISYALTVGCDNFKEVMKYAVN